MAVGVSEGGGWVSVLEGGGVSVAGTAEAGSSVPGVAGNVGVASDVAVRAGVAVGGGGTWQNRASLCPAEES